MAQVIFVTAAVCNCECYICQIVDVSYREHKLLTLSVSVCSHSVSFLENIASPGVRDSVKAIILLICEL